MTRYECSTCGNSLAACRCANPQPAVDGVLYGRRARTWTRAEIVQLLADEAKAQQERGTDLVRAARAERRRRD